jgi:hypothetical protein
MYWNAEEGEKLLDVDWLNSTMTIEFNHLRIYRQSAAPRSGSRPCRRRRPVIHSFRKYNPVQGETDVFIFGSAASTPGA